MSSPLNGWACADCGGPKAIIEGENGKGRLACAACETKRYAGFMKALPLWPGREEGWVGETEEKVR